MNTLKLGNIVMTDGVKREIDMQDILICLNRHLYLDFGDLCEDDVEANLSAIKNNDDSVLSSYKINDKKFWIITEWDRSVTTILLPEEY